MAHRSGGRGTYVLDRTFPGVGRIVRSSGTHRVRVVDAMNAMCSVLWETGRLDVLRRIQAGTLHPMVAFSEWRATGGVARPSSVPSVATMREWAMTARVSHRHQLGLRSCLGILIRAEPRAPITALPRLLRTYRRTAPPRTFNKTRAAVQAFLRDTEGRRSPLYGEVTDVRPLPHQPAQGNPFALPALQALDLPAPLLGMAWTMATTGMGPAEYWGRWSVDGAGVRIHGTKRAGRERLVPLIRPPVLPSCRQRVFQEAFQAATGHDTYDLRRTYATLLEQARIPGSRIRAYLGHGPRTVTDLYLRADVLPYLRGDAKAVRRVLTPAGRRKAAR